METSIKRLSSRLVIRMFRCFYVRFDSLTNHNQWKHSPNSLKTFKQTHYYIIARLSKWDVIITFENIMKKKNTYVSTFIHIEWIAGLNYKFILV